MGKYVKPTAQKTFVKKEPQGKPAEAPASTGIEPTTSWINAKGKAVYVNIAEADINVKDGRVAFITSLSNLKRLVEGEIGGVNLGRFVD